MSGFGRRQKKPSEQMLQARQFSTSSMPYGESIAPFLFGVPGLLQNPWQWNRWEFDLLCGADRQGFCRYDLTNDKVFKRYRSVQYCSR